MKFPTTRRSNLIMGPNSFTPDFHDSGPDNALPKGTLPKFDVPSLYMGIEKLPARPSTPVADGITFEPIFTGKDGLTPYKLPETEVAQPTGQSTLDALTRRITDKATDNVQKHMTPQEKKDLNEDVARYAKQMEDYEKDMQHALIGKGLIDLGSDAPKPQKPASLVRYEQAIDAEIKKIAQNLA
jgi:hypothetical protein